MDRSGQSHIFIGPSARLVDAWLHENCSGEIRRYAPARRGDLADAPIAAGDRVVIVDATLVQEPGPSHREILDLVDKGVHVVGAGSTGALRAAELVDYGMSGIGVIYESLLANRLRDDGELVVTMDPQSFSAMTVPVINVRRLLNVMATRLSLRGERLSALFERAVAIPHFERDVMRICDEWAGEGARLVQLFKELAASELYDVKSIDAMLAISATLHAPAAEFHPNGEALRLRVSDLYW